MVPENNTEKTERWGEKIVKDGFLCIKSQQTR